ncbi:MAG: twin-arginine translocase subunit TatC [Chloroflexota bacterium]|nr:twin-arginine translocase subunit TatC [Chloroflexota bacterium]
MTLMEHLQELRRRLVVAGLAVVLSTGASFYFATRILEFLKEPAEERSSSFKLIFTEPMEGVVAYFRISLLAGLTLAMPIIIYELLMFVAPALSRREKRWVYSVVVGATLAFAGGVAFAYYVALPPALGFLLNFPEDVAEPQIKIGSYVDFVTRLLLWTGVVFETPLVIMGVARFGVVTSRQLVHLWRYAIIGAFVVAAIVTPSIDPVTQSLVAGPLIVLYVLGIVLARIVEPRRGRA